MSSEVPKPMELDIMGYVYMITNDINSKAYIGICIHPPEKTRIKVHLSGRGNQGIADDIELHGKDAFTYEILEANVFDELLPELEVAYIANFNTVVPNGYNLNSGGSHAIPSEETRRKLSEAKKGRTRSPRSAEHRRKLSEANKGKTLSEETRRKISESKKGKKPTADTRRKLSEARKGENNPNFGKTLPPEQRRKISEALKGERNYNFGKTLPPEQRRKISEALKGKKLSAERCRKISEARMHPDQPDARNFFLSLPPDIPLKEKRKLLYTEFPNVTERTIRRWVQKWSS